MSPKRGTACLIFEYVPALGSSPLCYVISPYDQDGSCSCLAVVFLVWLHARLGVGWLVLQDIAGSSAGKQPDVIDMAPLPAKSSKRHTKGLDRRQGPINVH